VGRPRTWSKPVQDERDNLLPNSDTCESEREHNRLFERPREVLLHRAGETNTDGRRRVATPYGGVIRNWPYAARKMTGDAESGRRPPPDKNIEQVPCWGIKIARRIASCTWDVKDNWDSDPADLIGGKTPDRAFWNAQIHIGLGLYFAMGGISGNIFFHEIRKIWHLLGKINPVLNRRKKLVRNLYTSRANFVSFALCLQ